MYSRSSSPRRRESLLLLPRVGLQSNNNGRIKSDPRLRGDDALAEAGPLGGPAPVRHLNSLAQ